ncbi:MULTISPECIES: alpha/beta fold hydrolase [Pseudonocardia]|uniref:2-hydroxy-6-oxononadienedioate/2-hydroxy-6-oxononatrienedioate hydrolase n=2 Tax=Pseudonocardia TaxID=1847 RepID=A0A1Y2MIX1_PSEAH|nr:MULTISPECIES: alpha/beta hydrolase [Pseudonocardia]OSY35190.1 2-hydroxy-6-oxononadienedioate/2-hydroxy-6-oxononatrienedioate hydrolase [Pseudonocardia autotrophica]TDN74999.1 pimeloyl-ACP methyl ester carboxylesterase [Pseudonocardia autotrophica]BBF98940.1 alpha/beta hydrolase [Pseudonocardia autotrophica]GEC23860.1 alpha/beta hydrolase [Pseudonocardia saturnea]
MTTLREHVIDRPEGRLHVRLAGDTGPPVLLLSGAGMDNASLSWARLIPDLARDHRVIAPDWPKQGGSRPWQGRATHDVLLRTITDVLDDLGIERATLVGLSQGGAMTLAYAIEHPERVERLVALAPGGTLSFPPVVHQLLWLMAKLPLLNRTLPNLAFQFRPSVAWFVRTALFGTGRPDDFDAIVDECLVEARRGGAGSSDWQNGSIGFRRMRVDLRPRLSEIRCPALFIQGDRDTGIPVARTRQTAAAVPGARLEVLPGRGHWSNRESPDEVNALIRAFLAEGR